MEQLLPSHAFPELAPHRYRTDSVQRRTFKATVMDGILSLNFLLKASMCAIPTA